MFRELWKILSLFPPILLLPHSGYCLKILSGECWNLLHFRAAHLSSSTNSLFSLVIMLIHLFADFLIFTTFSFLEVLFGSFSNIICLFKES